MRTPSAAKSRFASLACLLWLSLALVLAISLPGCQGCSESAVNPESAEDAGRIWGELLCDMRESRVTLYINDFDNQHGISMIRAQLLAGDDDGKARARFIGKLNDFIEEHGEAIVGCTSTVTDKDVGEDGRVTVGISMEYKEIATDQDGDYELVDIRRDLRVVTTEIDGTWRVTGEPADTPGLDDFVLFDQRNPVTMP